MYKPQPAAMGYYAPPMVRRDVLVGKVDAIADRKASTLQVNAIHEDVAFISGVTKA
jgi:uncharacterized protein